MNSNKIEIVHFDIYQRIFMNYFHNFLIPNYRERILAYIQADGDINLIEIYEILNMPVIKLQKDTKPPQSKIRIKIFYHSGTYWQSYIANF